MPMRTSEYLDRKIETATIKEVRKLQEAKLGRELDYLFARSLFYQEKFQAAGLRRKDYRGLRDLAKFPFTTKEELRESQAAHPPLGSHVAADLDDIIRVHSSTGTTGKPSFVGITRRDSKVWTAITARSFYTQGLRKSDIVIHAAGLTMFVAGLSSKDAIESVGAMFVPIGTGASEKAVMAIQLLNATAMHCTPSYATYFAEWVRREAKLDPRELGLKKLFCGAEPGAGIPAVRAKLQEAWGARVTEGLGNADMAPIIFSECTQQSGMHFNAQEYVLPEIIDPESGESLPIEKGVTGELVYTSLERECVPLLRFRTRDRVTVLDTSCPCGRTSFKLRCIGRTDDMLIVLGVNVFPSQIEEMILRCPALAPHYEIEITRPNRLDEIRIVVEARAGLDDPARAAEAALLAGKLKDHIGISAQIHIAACGSLPRSSGKAVHVRDRR